MKDIGLVGAPFSGKSTLFTALTHAGGHGGQANVAVVPVPDPRLQVLTDMERSAKTVAAQVGFVDVPGGLANAQGVATLRETDALAVVVRCFGPDAAPAKELDGVRADLLLSDLGRGRGLAAEGREEGSRQARTGGRGAGRGQGRARRRAARSARHGSTTRPWRRSGGSRRSR